MTTTVMRDSIVGDDWIYQTAQAVPIQKIIDETTGQPTGDFLTGPVRLAFDNLFELPKPKPGMENPKYGAALLFSPWADFAPLYEEYNRLCGQKFADKYDARSGQYVGLYSPFRDQSEKANFGGFTPGLVFLSSTSKFKPPVIDSRYNPIVDPSKAYAGVWAICSINAYTFDDPRKKGVAFGLQSVMIIGDDTKFGGGAPDPTKTMAAVRGLVSAPIARPDPSRMGQSQPAAQPAGIPGYTQHAPAQAHRPAAAPQQQYAAPQHQAYTPPVMPGQPTQGDDDMDFMN